MRGGRGTVRMSGMEEEEWLDRTGDMVGWRRRSDSGIGGIKEEVGKRKVGMSEMVVVGLV